VFWLCVWFATNAAALTFEYTDGTKISGEIVRPDAKFLQVRTEDNKYVEIDWGKLSQATLAELKTIAEQKRDTKLLENVEPYIEISDAEKIAKTEVKIKTDYEKLERPAKGSLIGALFQSSVGLVCLLLLYAANIYAGYEIACVRAYPIALVCGIAAIAPVIGPVVFLCLPTKLPSREDEVEEEPGPAAAPAVPAAQSATYNEESPAETAAAAAAVPQIQVFKRGQFTFNRRFIETKFSPFFGAIRRGEHKDLVLVVKAMRGEHIATRISRIAANDMHLEVQKGGAAQEVQIPFVEIQEIQIKHQDA